MILRNNKSFSEYMSKGTWLDARSGDPENALNQVV